MNTWAVELVSKLVDESKTWEEFGANVAKELMRQRASGYREAADYITRPGLSRYTHVHAPVLRNHADKIERGEA